MKRHFLIFFASIFISQTIQAQFTSSFISNPVRYNPALTGDRVSINNTNFYNLSSYYKLNIHALNASMPFFKNRLGVGINFMNQNNDYEDQLAFDISLAYHLPIKEGKLSIGASKGFTRINRLVYLQDLTSQKVGFSTGRTGVGLMYSNDKFFISVASPNLERDISNIELEELSNGGFRVSIDNRNLMDANIGGGIRLNITDNIELMPSVMYYPIITGDRVLRNRFSDVIEFLATAKFYDKFQFNISYAHNLQFDFAGLNSMMIGGAYHLPNNGFIGTNIYVNSPSSAFSMANIEVVLGMRLQRKNSEGIRTHF